MCRKITAIIVSKTMYLSSQQGMTPLQHAAFRAKKEVCELLLAHGADVNSNYHKDRYSCLMFAALSGDAYFLYLFIFIFVGCNALTSVLYVTYLFIVMKCLLKHVEIFAKASSLSCCSSFSFVLFLKL